MKTYRKITLRGASIEALKDFCLVFFVVSFVFKF
jgi:hypothetical protein